MGRGRWIAAGAACLGAVALSGCATVTRGTNEDLVVRTTPDGARALLSVGGTSRVCAATPCTFRIPRRSTATVLVSKDGFKTVRADVRGRLSGFVPLGVVGAAVDVASGAALRLQPNPIEITLEPGTGEVPYTAPAAAPSPR